MLQLLANPSYAGAYVFGRYRSRRAVDPDGTIRLKSAELPREQWQVLIRDHYPAYIAWENFLTNINRLAANCTSQGARPAREGSALLQGVVLCGGRRRLWAAPTTSDRERKRLLRTLVGDVTLVSEPSGDRLRIGIRWRSGACEELMTRRPHSAWQARRTQQSAVDLAKRLGAQRTDAQLTDELNRTGLTTGIGKRFTASAVSWMRYA